MLIIHSVTRPPHGALRAGVNLVLVQNVAGDWGRGRHAMSSIGVPKSANEVNARKHDIRGTSHHVCAAKSVQCRLINMDESV